MVKYQFAIDDETWQEWKDTVPRSKSLDTRIRELIQADTEGRVIDEESSEDNAAHPVSAPTADVTAPSEEPRGTADVPDDVREQLRSELAGGGDLLEARVDEILKMYDYLREHGTAEKDELLDVVDVDATDYAGRDSVWSNMVKGKDTLRALPGVQTPPTGRTEWKYTHDESED